MLARRRRSVPHADRYLSSIDIPVVSVVWTFNGMSAEEMQDRILVKHERQMASLVDDIARIEANSYVGVGVIKAICTKGRREAAPCRSFRAVQRRCRKACHPASRRR